MDKIRVFLQQRVIPTYRIPLMENLAKHPLIDLTVFAGQPMPHEMIKTGETIENANFIHTKNIHLFKGPLYLCSQKQIIQALDQTQPQVLILEGNARYLSTRKAFSWAKIHHSPLIGWGLGVPQKGNSVFTTINHRFWKNFLNSFDAMLAYSQTGASQYQNIGFSQEQVFVAVNATTHRPTTTPPQKQPAFTDNQPILLYVGRLQARKRLDSLIRVCAQSPLKPVLWIVGDGPVRTDLETFAKNHYPPTKFFGELYGDDLTQIYHKADLFVLPGTGGLAAQQAMAHGLPVIMAAGDGTQADLITPDTGWTVPPNDEAALNSAVNKALSDPMLLRKKGLAAYHLVKNEVNIESMTEKFVSAIEFVLYQKDKP